MRENDISAMKTRIHNALKTLMILLVKNNMYGDVDGLLDDTPFMPLFISLKKSVYEKLLTQAIQNQEVEETELAILQAMTPIRVDGSKVSFPELSAFTMEEGRLRFCGFDLERFQEYLSKIEDILLSTSYAQVIGLIYSRLSMGSGVGLSDTIRQNKIEHAKKNQTGSRNEFDRVVATDWYDYAIHWEDDANLWSIDTYSYAYGKTLYYFESEERFENYKHMLNEPEGIDLLVAQGLLLWKDIEIRIPCFMEDISKAFYESKCIFEHGYSEKPCENLHELIKSLVTEESGKKKAVPADNDIGHIYLFKYLVHPNEIKGLSLAEQQFREEMEARGYVFVDDKVRGKLVIKDKDRPIGKGMFNRLLAPTEDGRLLSDHGHKIVLGYMLFLETVLEALKMPDLQLPEDLIDEVVEDVAFRVAKVAILNKINFRTRKSHGNLKKGDLQAMIKPRSRWRSCINYYSDDMFTADELDKFSKYLGIVLK